MAALGEGLPAPSPRSLDRCRPSRGIRGHARSRLRASPPLRREPDPSGEPGQRGSGEGPEDVVSVERAVREPELDDLPDAECGDGEDRGAGRAMTSTVDASAIALKKLGATPRGYGTGCTASANRARPVSWVNREAVGHPRFPGSHPRRQSEHQQRAARPCRPGTPDRRAPAHRGHRGPVGAA